jgi:hypothetical protein
MVDCDKALSHMKILYGKLEEISDDIYFEHFDGHFKGTVDGTKKSVDLYNSCQDSITDDIMDGKCIIKVDGEIYKEGAIAYEFTDGNGMGESWLCVEESGESFTVIVETENYCALRYDCFKVVSFDA